MRVIALVLLAVVGLAVGLAPLHLANPSVKITDKYIVVYHKNVTVEELEDDLLRISSLAAVSTDRVYTKTLRGYAASLTARQLAVVRANPKVAHVEEDQVMSLSQCSTETNAGWGLVRVSQRAKIGSETSYKFPSHQGEGVTAYIIDTGIYVEHEDFEGRARFGYKSDSSWKDTDGNGHGTHVSSTVGGKRYGVAKAVELIGVKVLSDAGSGSTAGVIAGVEWAAKDRSSHNRPSVGNMSLGGGKSLALNEACNAASEAGVLMVVAAGNENSDACNRSPASAENVVTTGAMAKTDTRSTFSNYGKCVDIFGPGTDILGAWIGSPSASRTISGTSMASPHVCGVSALVVSRNPSFGLKELKDELQKVSTKDALELNCANAACRESPNSLAYNGC